MARGFKMFRGRIVQPLVDKLFAESTALLSGDYAILTRYGDDDYVRPASPDTDCSKLNDLPGTQDDFTEPNRWLINGTVQVSAGEWVLLSEDALVKTNYNCYPSGGDFRIEAQLRYTPGQAALSLPSRYLVEAIVLFYGCCYMAGIGYARWKEGSTDRYGGVRIALAGTDFVATPSSENTRTVVIERINGQLNLDGLLSRAYILPEPIGIKRVSIRVG
jgi:hypothetical protein